MSLEERIRRFAEQARGYLLEEFARSTQKDTEVVQWQGYSEDGKLIARDKDLNPIVDGVGQKYQTKGSNLILDSAGTVEQRKARRKEQAAAPEKGLQPIPEEQIVPRSANPIIDLFFLEELEGGEFLPIFELPSFDVGLHVVISRPFFSDYETDLDVRLVTGSASGPASSGAAPVSNAETPQYVPHSNASHSGLFTSDWAQDYGYAKLVGTMWSLYANYVNPPPYQTIGTPPTVQITSTSNNFDYSANVSGSQNATWDLFWSSGFYSENTNATVSYTRNLWYYDDPYISYRFGGDAAVEISFSSVAIGPTKFYYQMSFGTRTIDLKDIVGNNIFFNRQERNFAKIEGDDIFIYSTFRVATVDINANANSEMSPSGYSGVSENVNKVVGEISFLWVHTRLNFRTGQVQSKTAESTEQYNTDAYTYEPFYNYKYLFHVFGVNQHLYETQYLPSQKFGQVNTIIVSLNAESNSDDYFNSHKYWNPIHAWQNSFEGDWIYAYKDMGWDATAAQNISYGELLDFYNCAYRNGRWYSGLDEIINPSPYNFYEWIPSANTDPEYAIGEPPANLTTVQKIEQLPIIIELYGNQIDRNDYFGGDYSTSPNDRDEWVDHIPSQVYPDISPFQNEDPYAIGGAYTYVMPTNLAPQFTSSTNIPSIDENGPANQVIYTATAVDEEDSSYITFELEQTDDYSYFNMNGADVRLTDPADYETKSSYVFTIVATDRQGASSKLTLTLQILDVAE